MLHNTISQVCGSQIDGAKTGCCHFTESERPIKDQLPPDFFCPPDNILSPDFKVFRGDISKRARHSETGTTLREHFLLRRVWKFKFLAAQWEAEVETSQKPPACAEKFLHPSGGDYQEGQREGGGVWEPRWHCPLSRQILDGLQSKLSAPFHDHLL